MIKQLLALLTLIPLATHAVNQAAYTEAQTKSPLELGREICAMQRKVEQSIVNSVIPAEEIDTATARKLPKELVRIIYDYQFPSMDEVYTAACSAVDLKRAQAFNHTYYSPYKIDRTHSPSYFDKSKMAEFETLGFKGGGSIPDYMGCSRCANAWTPVISWMLFPFHNVPVGGGQPSNTCATLKTQYGQNIPYGEQQVLQRYLLSYFYNHIDPQIKGVNTLENPSILYYLMTTSNRFEMGDRQYLETAAAQAK